jgi:hypothetical protein
MAGLATPTMKKENDILAATRKAFGKLDRKSRSLEQWLQGLTEQELGLVVRIAQFVKMAHSFGGFRPDKPKEPYINLNRNMYPKLPYHLQSLIADVLQDAEPIEEQPKLNKREAIIRGVQDSYAWSGEPEDAKVTVANAQDKAEELKDKILESLKLND